MFSKSRNDPTVIADGAKIEGTIRLEGTIHIDGQVKGTLEVNGTVSIGPKGKVIGDIHADEVTIAGRVEGSVLARKNLHMRAKSLIKGDAHYEHLRVDPGGAIEGQTKRLNPGSVVPDATHSASGKAPAKA